MKHIASCSFGKDSLATVILAKEYGEPLDEVVYCEVMFDQETSGEIPEHRDFIYNVAIPKLESWGIKVVVVRSEKTFVSSFMRVIQSGPRAGMIKAWPLCGRCAIQRDCKIPPINRYKRQLDPDAVQYIGIAKDEQERLIRLDGKTRVSLLDKYGVEEDDTFPICREHGLLSPIYEFTNRGGCFFCPNAKEKELRHLYDHHKDLWNRLLELQRLPNKATELFNRDLRFDEIDAMFRMDDAQVSLFDIIQNGGNDNGKAREYFWSCDPRP